MGRSLWIMGLLGLLPALFCRGELPVAGSPAAGVRQLVGVHVPGSVGGNALCGDGSCLYLAGKGRLQVFDLRRNPMKPQLAAEVKGLPWVCRQMAVHRGYAYITARNQGLWIVDLRNPVAPKLVGNFDTAELATGVDVSGNLLFVALRYYGVQIFDITNPAAPKHITLFRNGKVEAQSIFCRGNLLAVGDWGHSRVQLLDVRNPAAPEEISYVPLQGYGDGVYLHGNLLYAATGHHSRQGSAAEQFGNGHGMEIFDVSDPRKAVRLGGVHFPRFFALGNDFWSVWPAGGMIAVADTYNGLFLVEAADPRNPRIVAQFQLPPVRVRKNIFDNSLMDASKVLSLKLAGDGKHFLLPDCVGSVVPANDRLYVAGNQSGLFVVELPGCAPVPAREELGRSEVTSAVKEVPGFLHYDCGGMVRRVATDGQLLYVAASSAGLQIWGEDDKGWKKIATISENRIYDVSICGTLLVAAEEKKLSMWRIQKGKLPVLLGQMKSSFPTQILHLYRNGTLAAVSGGGNRIDFIDLRDPARPRMLVPSHERRILYIDSFPEKELEGLIAVNSYGAGLSWYRLEETGGRKLRSNPALRFNQFDGVTAVGKQFLMPSGKQFYLFSPEKFGSDEFSQKFPAPPGMEGLPSWNGGSLLAFSHRSKGKVTLFDVTNPETPQWKKSFDFLPGTPDRVVFYRNRLIVPAGFDGLYCQKP